MASIDQNVLQFFVNHRTDWLSTLMYFFTTFGNVVPTVAIVCLVLTILYTNKNSKYILPFLISVAGSAGTMYIIKIIFNKPRPLDFALYLESGYSFPSGHATLAIALYGILIYTTYNQTNLKLKNLLILGFILLILSIGLSRLYLGVHYISDVLTGYLLGFIWVWIGIGVSKSKLWHPRDNEHL